MGTDRINWKDELNWLAIAIVSAFLLSLFFLYFNKFPGTKVVVIYVVCLAGFYLLSILLRIQNHRGKPLTGKTAIKEKYIKYIFPLLGFAIGFAILFLT